jgi:hypothetical protein
VGEEEGQKNAHDEAQEVTAEVHRPLRPGK